MERSRKPYVPIQIEVLIPDDEKELKTLFRYVTPEDRRTIIENIREISRAGTSRDIRRLKLPGQNGEPLYSRRVGKIRVLLTEVESLEGKRVFEIYAAPKYRKDAYSRIGIRRW